WQTLLDGREPHAVAVGEVVDAADLAAPDGDAVGALGADREVEPVPDGALVVDLLPGARRGQRRAHAAARAAAAHGDRELDAPQALGIAGHDREAVAEDLPREDPEAERDEDEARGGRDAIHCAGGVPVAPGDVHPAPGNRTRKRDRKA